jgi:hypothetical protein
MERFLSSPVVGAPDDLGFAGAPILFARITLSNKKISGRLPPVNALRAIS